MAESLIARTDVGRLICTTGAVAIIAAGGVIGGLAGRKEALNEQSLARKRIVTVDSCRKTYAEKRDTIGENLLRCLNNGSLGGAPTSTNLAVGDASSLLDTYRQKQVAETHHFDTGAIRTGIVEGGAIGAAADVGLSILMI